MSNVWYFWYFMFGLSNLICHVNVFITLHLRDSAGTLNSRHQSVCTPDQIFTSWSIIKYNPTIFWTHIIGPSVLISSSNLRHMMISISSFITIPYIVTQTQLTTHNKLKINFKIWTKSWSQLSFIGLTNIQLNVTTECLHKTSKRWGP